MIINVCARNAIGSMIKIDQHWHTNQNTHQREVVMKLSDIRTIELQEDRIKQLEKENKELRSGYDSLHKANEQFRERIKLLEQAHGLSKVNV